MLNEVLEEVRTTWERRHYGTNIGNLGLGARLTHVAFADDCTLVARSWLTLKRMMLQLRDGLKKRGLSLHPSKCKVQTNTDTWNARGICELDAEMSVEVLAVGEPLTILGTALALSDTTQQEIPNRIATGWRLFWSMKQLLLNRKISVKRRLKLFDSTVGSCVLWCCQSWSLRREEERKLRSVRRSMLRKIVGSGRAPDETWVDWLQRVTHKAENLAAGVHVRDWVDAHALAKWRWAGHVIRIPTTAWAWRLTVWRDSAWQRLATDFGSMRPLRPSRRRWTKWEDPLRRFDTEWQSLAAVRERWAAKEETFAHWFSGALE